MAFREDLGGGPRRPQQKNVLGGALALCSAAPRTGFYRDGCCHTGPDDQGVHTVCAVMTEAFLSFSKARGNDLSTPRPEYDFPGLKPGDRWCLCAARWREALLANAAPKVILAATNARTLGIVELDDLKAHAADLN
ncbi:MAG TPA: DUF2237 domain-containing protein [Alphaproteobacteria bacterium]|nr:DUF2237 domain-containing protein [Alphaproteobacteria bacterium]HAJ48454.1 DUF2237 domain-containing protein [Alphaproteobacteria bacterium]